jgi:hypothetical protein
LRVHLVSIAVFVILLAVTSARAAATEGEATDAEEVAEATDTAAHVLETFAPPPVDGPEMRVPSSPTRLYVDTTFARSADLSALPFIAGSGRNIRFAAGGAWRLGDFTLDAEIPFTQVTTLSVTAIPGGAPIPQDAHQTAVSFGDVRFGATWTRPLSPTLVGGFGLRARLPTHTTAFQFHLVDNSLATYAFPYYFHIEPTAILGGALGRFTFVLNQGVVVLMGPDGQFGGMPIHEPTIVFWDAAYAVGYAPWDVLGGSVELGTDIQLTHVDGVDFQKLNDVRSAWIAPALQVHAGAYRVDLIARIGLTRGADLFGVIEYAGTSSYTLRVSRTFN